MKQMLDRLGTAEDPLRDALEAAERVRQIVRDLRIFARSDSEDAPQAVDVQKVLDSALRMAANEVRHRARLVRNFHEIPLVQGNESRLGQVFLNLVVNAAQAIAVGQATENEIKVTAVPEGTDFVAVEIADTGVGIPADKLERVFDPFFTTKPAGVGTGLGLAICHRIITELGGTISVSSTVGKGTTFRVVLRRAAPTPMTMPAANASSMSTSVRRGRVLVVDDEAPLCKTIERIVAEDHDVVAVTSARDAIATIAAGSRFDVILSDLMMPEMTGMELYSTLRESTPDQARRMIFMTGGAFSPDATKFLAQQDHDSIEKPFRPSALRSAVQAALAKLGTPA